MSATLSPKELERKAFRSTFQDGIWDIYLGLLLLLMGVSSALTRITELRENQLVLIMLISAVVIMTGFFLGKKFITAPRLGRAKFSEERKTKVKKVRLALSRPCSDLPHSSGSESSVTVSGVYPVGSFHWDCSDFQP